MGNLGLFHCVVGKPCYMLRLCEKKMMLFVKTSHRTNHVVVSTAVIKDLQDETYRNGIKAFTHVIR